MTNLVRKAANAIIRPPRKTYDLSTIPKFLQGDDDKTYIRQPIELTNRRKLKLVGSYYYSSDMNPTAGGPCVIYLHGNASSQLEGQFLVPNLCRYGIYVFCFDFAGCGCSEGKYVSLGYYEKEDTEFMIDHLRSQFNLGPFILWGRSMGAATALLIDSPLIAARVSDSSFTSVSDMCSAIATSMHFPPLFIQASLWFLKKQVIKRAKFDFSDVSPISISRENEIPALFGHSEYDQFIPFEQCQRLYNHYQTREKYIMALDGGHNSKRSDEWIRFGVCFIFENFGLNIENPVISSCRRLQEKTFHFSSFSAMMEATDANDLNLADDDDNFVMNEEDVNDDHQHEEEKKELKKVKKRKNKRNRNSINRLSGSFILEEEKKKKKKRKSLRLKKLSLKNHHKKHKKHHHHHHHEEEDEEEKVKEINRNFKEDKNNETNPEVVQNENENNKTKFQCISNENEKCSSNKKVRNYNKFILGEESSSEKVDDIENDHPIQDSKIISHEKENENDPALKIENYNKFILGLNSSSDMLIENEPSEKNKQNKNDAQIKDNKSAVNYNKFILGLNSSSDQLIENEPNAKDSHNEDEAHVNSNKSAVNYNKFILGLNSSSDQLIENEQNAKDSHNEDVAHVNSNKSAINYNKFILGLSSSSDQLADNEKEQNEKDSQNTNETHAKSGKSSINYNKFILGLSSSSDQLFDNENENDNNKSNNSAKQANKSDISYNGSILGENNSSDKIDNDQNKNNPSIEPDNNVSDYNKFILGDNDHSSNSKGNDNQGSNKTNE